MKNREIILVGITALTAISLFVLIAGKTKKQKTFERLHKIAEEGYETAGDILYPGQKPLLKREHYTYYRNY